MYDRLQRGFRVGEYEVRPLQGQIIGPNGSQHIQPKVMDILVCLAEHPGDLVERNILIERGWGGEVDSDDVLTRCISELRHHLDDHQDSVRYIQTVPKRGYRLIANVTLDQDADHTPAPVPAQGREDRSSVLAGFWIDLQRRNVMRVSIAYIVVGWLALQVGETIFTALHLPDWTLTLLLALLIIGFPIAVILAWLFQVTPEGVVLDVVGAPARPIALRRNLDILIIGSLVIAVVVLGYGQFANDDAARERAEFTAVGAERQQASIAVLRFLNIGGLSHFADGLGEELLDRLADIKELGVAARTSSWAFADSDVDVPTIAARLKVDYVLEGSVRHSGDRIRITAQLNDGETGKHVWSQTYDRELTVENFFETQTDIARQVVGLLQISLSPESKVLLDARPHTNMQALDYYLQGQEYFRQPHSDATLDNAAKFFNRSLEVDPRFAMAYAGLCDAELGKYIIARDIKVFERAERACHRALTLDEYMPRVQAALGGLYLFSGQNAKAEETLRQALNDNPNLIDAYADLGEAIENQGRVDEAEKTLGAMVTRQPGYWYGHNALGNFFYRQSRYDEAAVAFTSVTELTPNRALGYNNLANAHYMMGDFDTASRAYEMSVQLEPYVDNYSNLGLAYFYDGQYAAAAEMQLKALELQPTDARVIGRLATAYHFAGREDDARALFRDAIRLLQEKLVINPNDIRLNRFIAVYNVSVGNIEEGQAAIARALEIQPDSSGAHYDAAKVAMATGDTEKALEYLRQASALGYSINIISSDPVFQALQSDTRFLLITEKEG